MPVHAHSDYAGPPRYLFNGHLQTVVPAITRKVFVDYRRERFTLSDGDFVDLDWVEKGSDKLLLLSHGLEGKSARPYIQGMAKIFTQNGWDALAWNCRSCSGEMNRMQRLYHHADIADIGEVIEHALKERAYKTIVLIGFSMGGSISLNYLGRNGKDIPSSIKAAVTFSVPCDLRAGIEMLEKPSNRFYKKRFLKSLRPKLQHKAEQFPGLIDMKNFDRVKQWRDFDTFFTVPLNGFRDADEFYDLASAKNHIAKITVPTLIVNALNDPIQDERCNPKAICSKHSNLFLELPKHGGHCGFTMRNDKSFAWSEYRAWKFVEEML